ncbi:MAG TPA: hypothetical protein PK609_01655 [Candidatus Paceibacterota bacterium]|nr:hypothetical protein [Candidatus Paceibacterota bacterium]
MTFLENPFIWFWTLETESQASVLALTAAVAIGFLQVRIGGKQNEINNSIQEVSLRPIILRGGTDFTWNQLANGLNRGEIFQFVVEKNIARNIRGHIIISNRKYKLLFDVGRKQPENRIEFGPRFLECIGWIKSQEVLCSRYDFESWEEVNHPNEIYLSYEDIAGRKYCTIEDADYVQSSKRLKS